LNEVTAAVPDGTSPPQMAPLLAIGLLAVAIPMCIDAAGLGAAMAAKFCARNPAIDFRRPH